MIDVLKRLEQLDAKNPNVLKESNVQECGPMGMMDSMPGMTAVDKPSVPANFNISASAESGNEVASMMSQILTLAGLHKVGPADLGHEPQGAVVTAEPVSPVGPMAAEPMNATDSMRAVLDKLNPEMDGEEGGEELGPFQHDSDSLQTGNDAGEEADDEEGEEETDEGNYFTGQLAQARDQGKSQADLDGDGDMDPVKKADETYDNTPADPNDKNPADADEYANHENQAGSGNDEKGGKRQTNLPTATFEALMKEYRQFIGESEEEEEMDESADDEEMDEGVEDRLKDLDPKNPVNIPAYQRKAKSGDSAQAAKPKESVEETADILKLAGLK